MQCQIIMNPYENSWYSTMDNVELDIPEDPRYWTRTDVAAWLQHTESQHHLPSIRLDRFFMNGKALCLMTMEMFLDRVPIGGKLLYKDFQLRLAKAIYNIDLNQS
nr:transcription factor ETV7-like [Halyomorpha halys]